MLTKEKTLDVSKDSKVLGTVGFKRQRGNTYLTIKSEIIHAWIKERSQLSENGKFFIPTYDTKRGILDIRNTMIDDDFASIFSDKVNIKQLFSSNMDTGFTFLIKNPMPLSTLKTYMASVGDCMAMVYKNLICDDEQQISLVIKGGKDASTN